MPLEGAGRSGNGTSTSGRPGRSNSIHPASNRASQAGSSPSTIMGVDWPNIVTGVVSISVSETSGAEARSGWGTAGVSACNPAGGGTASSIGRSASATGPDVCASFPQPASTSASKSMPPECHRSTRPIMYSSLSCASLSQTARERRESLNDLPRSALIASVRNLSPKRCMMTAGSETAHFCFTSVTAKARSRPIPPRLKGLERDSA